MSQVLSRDDFLAHLFCPGRIRRLLCNTINTPKGVSLVRNMYFNRQSFTKSDEDDGILKELTASVLQKVIEDMNIRDMKTVAIQLLNACLETSNRQLCADVISRVTSPRNSGESTYLEDQILPLLSNLSQAIQQYSTPRTVEAYTSAFQTLFMYWLENILKPIPAIIYDPLGSHEMDFCSCDLCRKVVGFLDSHTEHLLLDRIGVENIRHLEGKLESANRPDAVSWQTMKTTPQGLWVRFHYTVSFSGLSDFERRSRKYLHVRCWRSGRLGGMKG